MVQHQLTAWVRCPRPSDQARIRIFCLPFGGGGAAIFREWPRDLWPEIEVWHVQLPGREARHREPALTRMDALVAPLADAMLPYLDRPYIVFGHSMGALIGFELARRLRQLGGAGPAAPVRLGAAGAARRGPAPAVAHPAGRGSRRAADPALQWHAPGSPGERRAAAHVHSDRASRPDDDRDVRPRAGSPARLPDLGIRRAGGRRRHRDDLAAWGDQTGAGFTLRMVPGGHFFLQTDRARLLAALRADLQQTLVEAT